MFKVLVEENAAQEFLDAYIYYESLHIRDLELKFELDFENTIEILEKDPYHTIKISDFRSIPMEVFPFLVFYKIYEYESEVKIVSIFHTSRNPSQYPN
jgi:hypothetical protein